MCLMDDKYRLFGNIFHLIHHRSVHAITQHYTTLHIHRNWLWKNECWMNNKKKPTHIQKPPYRVYESAGRWWISVDCVWIWIILLRMFTCNVPSLFFLLFSPFYFSSPHSIWLSHMNIIHSCVRVWNMFKTKNSVVNIVDHIALWTKFAYKVVSTTKVDCFDLCFITIFSNIFFLHFAHHRTQRSPIKYCEILTSCAMRKEDFRRCVGELWIRGSKNHSKGSD